MVRYPPAVASDPKGDELGRTATDAASMSSPAVPADPVGPCVGRYRLERELGAGAMGVVHAAFDPDLERRIALKVLRVVAPGTHAKDRLLREARAMARLAHPNVVTVHEVGTTNGRDYIAMELILGETLADWLRSEDRRPADIIASFVAAGRGLAAAHAAGIVHRDFKPHNVLRNRDGRIVVTDFGLAREAQGELPMHLEATLPLPSRSATASGTPSSLAGITVTGSLLGTPAYMAPEQWSGGAVTPATDQFAFCVALWEALAGERPYRGPTLDELRAQAALGPVALDARKIPRRLRAILRRGLDPDPARRWPNMDALLARVVRVERRPAIALAIAVGGLVAAAVLVLAVRGRDHAVSEPRCEPPALDPDAVWSSSARGEVGRQTVAAAALDVEIGAWRSARAEACRVAPVVRAPRLACLDGVLARIDAVARGVRAVPGDHHVDAGALLIDPFVCELSPAPRLVATTSPEFREVVTAWLAHTATPVPIEIPVVNALVAKTAADPCASSLAHLLAADSRKSGGERRKHLDEAQQDAERCGDDRLRAETALAAAQNMIGNEWLSEGVTAKLRLADAAVHRVAQRDLAAQVDLIRSSTARRAENIDEAIARATAAMDGFAARRRLRAQLRAGLSVLRLREVRATPADLEAISSALVAWRARAVGELGEGDDIVQTIDARSAEWAFSHGDVTGAHAQFERLRRVFPNDKGRRLTGTVVDQRGKPVPGATVIAGWSLLGDSIGVVNDFRRDDSIRSTRSGPDGRFDIPDAVEDAIVIAQLGVMRSSPALRTDNLRLELGPTSRIEGRVALAGAPPTNTYVVVSDVGGPMIVRYALIAPVAADGSFAIDGVPRRQVRVFAEVEGLHESVLGGANVTVREPVVRGIGLSRATSSRVVHVLVRNQVNTRLSNAQVIVLPGKLASMSALALNQQFRSGSVRMARQLEGEHAPKPVVAVARPGDLFATMTEVPEGVASACALGLPDLSDQELERKLLSHLDRLQMICVPIPARTDVVAIEVPPLPRLD
jgi:predicted Ser/Thr protein kinase